MYQWSVVLSVRALLVHSPCRLLMTSQNLCLKTGSSPLKELHSLTGEDEAADFSVLLKVSPSRHELTLHRSRLSVAGRAVIPPPCCDDA